MRIPVVRSEPDAFRIAYVFALVTGVSVLLGIATEPVVGAALFTACALAALVWDLTTTDPDRRQPLLEAEHAPHPAPPAGRRILVIANEALEGDRIRDEIRSRAGDGPLELVVLAPVLTSKAHFVTSDVDREMEDAQARLHSTLAWAKRNGFAALGEVGDPNAPLASVEDELRRYGPDEVLVVTHPDDRRNWLEGSVLDRVREELDIPVTHAVVDSERHAVEILR